MTTSKNYHSKKLPWGCCSKPKKPDTDKNDQSKAKPARATKKTTNASVLGAVDFSDCGGVDFGDCDGGGDCGIPERADPFVYCAFNANGPLLRGDQYSTSGARDSKVPGNVLLELLRSIHTTTSEFFISFDTNATDAPIQLAKKKETGLDFSTKKNIDYNITLKEIRETSSNPVESIKTPGQHRIVLHSHQNLQCGEISLGTPPQIFNMIFDTMTSDLWVPTRSPGSHHLYNHSASSTYKANGSYFNSPYVVGFLSGDVLRIGDLEILGQFFGEATDTSPLGPGYPFAIYGGVFGLGVDAACIALVETSLTYMTRQGSLDRKMFSIYSGRNGKLGELLLGGYDVNRFKGKLVFLNTAYPDVWAVWLDEI